MFKKYWVYVLITILIITTLWLIKSKSHVSINQKNKFEIEDTSLITRIFLADRNGNTITLKKTKEKWIVNDKFTARNDAINTLLSTAEKIRIKKPVSKTAIENVIKFIATTGVYIEFFQNEKMIKSYTIGSNTPDHLGTYMLNRNNKVFVTHIPSFNGFLSPRYGIKANTLDVLNWRTTNVLNISKKDIKNIKYVNYLQPEKSYFLKTNPIKLINSKNQEIPFNKEKIFTLLNSFTNLNCESFKKDKDRINSGNQIEELIINTDTLRTYKISVNHEKSKEENFTISRKYATLNNGDLMLIQDYVFNKVLISITELTN